VHHPDGVPLLTIETRRAAPPKGFEIAVPGTEEQRAEEK
jgi:hypothetical protein